MSKRRETVREVCVEMRDCDQKYFGLYTPYQVKVTHNYECDYGLYTGQGFEQTNVRSMCHNAVREAQRIMKEGGER